ncbi:MAG TPA: serpin family protein [Terriglobales bacterium]|nr:serpin family protein [Terriglobales bacterium]
MLPARPTSAVLGLLLSLWACGAAAPGPTAARACARAPGGDAGSALAAASQTFGMSLTRQLATRTSHANVLVSPLSAQLALAMAAVGARGATQRAMLDALGLAGFDGNFAARAAQELIGGLAASRCGALLIANGMWARRGLALDAGFVRTVRTAFAGEVAPLDTDPAKAGQAINDWVSRRTHGRVPSIVDAIPPEVVLELLNATYFHGDWRSAFDPGTTREAPFHRPAGGDVAVPSMDRAGDLVYGRGPGYQAVALPYADGATRMVVLLPDASLAAAGFAPYLDAARLQQITAGLHGAQGELQLPRFGVDVTASLLEPLAALGMDPAFQPSADFSGIARSCGGCQITEVKQRVRLQVDERGTTAAAATQVEIAVSSSTLRMVVDRPFLVAIQDIPSGTLLFVGVVADPTG